MLRLTRNKTDGSVVYSMDRSELEDRISYGHWRPRRKKAPLQVAMSRLVPVVSLGRNGPRARPKRSGLWNAWKATHGSRVHMMTRYLIDLMVELVGPDKFDAATLATRIEQMCYDTFDRDELWDCVQGAPNNI